MINRDSAQTFKTRASGEPESQLRLSEKLLENKEETKEKKQRLNSLDVFRGLTMIGMIMVDNQGPSPPWFLDHAEWNGLTPADLIFPGFLFIMGVAIPLAVSPNRPVRPRTFLRILGLFTIGFLISLTNHKFDFTNVRILGILQRISLCYGIVVLIHWITSYGIREKKLRILGGLFVMGLIMVYLAFMLPFEKQDIGCTHENNLSPFCNFSAYVDRQLFTLNHMIQPNDPEGLFSTLTAIANTYAGYCFCLIMMDNKSVKKILCMWISISVLCAIIAYPLTHLMPLNKKIWSVSFTFLTIGISGLSLVFFAWLVDMVGVAENMLAKVINVVTRPLLWLGRNPLAIFILMDALTILLAKYITFGEHDSALSEFYKQVFASWIDDKEIASTIFALFFVLLWTIVAGLLFRWKIFLRL